MNRRTSTWVFFLAVSAVLFAATNPPGRSTLIRNQIDDLLAIKRRAAPLPADPPDPFALPTRGGATADPATAAAPPSALRPAAPATITPAEQLARLASRLRISGVIRIKDQLQIIINDTPYKEGDIIPFDTGTRRVLLLLVRLAPGQLTLRLDEAELTQKF